MGSQRQTRYCFIIFSSTILLIFQAALASASFAASQPQTKSQASPPAAVNRLRLLVIVQDENGIVLPSAHVSLYPPGAAPALRGWTDAAGRQVFSDVSAGAYRLVIEKEGFYAVTLQEVNLPQTERIEVKLNRTQEYRESVQVTASTEAIDPAQVAATQNLNGREVLELPYPTTRDIRNVLSFLPGVLPDHGGQVHVNGSASNQALYTLDGFDISQPVSGLLNLRVSTDAIRGIEVQGSRASAEYGRGSAGFLNLETGMGDDHFRFYATDFVPSFQTNHGLKFQNTTPRFTFSGPIKQGKAWFYEAVEGEYDQDIFRELPAGANTDYFWRFSNLVRAQVNLTPGNRLAGSFVVNRSRDDFFGLSITRPLSTTTTDLHSAYLATLKDQASWSNGVLLETGFGFVQFGDNNRPLGDLPYVVIPGSALGNYYRTLNTTARRFEALAHLYLPPAHWHGRHQFLAGIDFERTTGAQSAARRPFTIQTCPTPKTPPGCTAQNSTLLERSVSFLGNQSFEQTILDAAGFVQDRWSVSDRLLFELGARIEGDDLLGRVNASPRLASTYALTSDRQTKLSAGIGLYYDRTSLEFLTRPLGGQRQDIFFQPNGVTPIFPPVIAQFQAAPSALEKSRSLNWSVGVERKLPAEVYLKGEFIEKRGMNGFDYQLTNSVIGANGVPSSGLFVLRNDREDKYDAVTISAKRTFRQIYPVLVSYTRSAARSNAVLDSTLDNPFFSPQLGGALPWDSPNRVLAWGWVPFRVPLLHAFTFGYTFDWRTGYAFSLVNRNQELVGLPDRTRFPDFETLNVHIEKQFHLFGFQWALRGGFNNVTGRKNPSVVDNNVDSPAFLTFGGFQHRAFTGRIRFLGRK